MRSKRSDVDVVVVSTPNAYLCEVAVAALENGKHVLIEKPMGRDLAEAEMLADVARSSRGLLKIGFNHRYHPALRAAHERFIAGEIGVPIAIRARYGHGGRPGYENEWRGDPHAGRRRRADRPGRARSGLDPLVCRVSAGSVRVFEHRRLADRSARG